MNSSENPSAIQSKKWIMESLVLLMEKKQFSTITVSEIAEKAGLVRRTFYRNFDSKEDVLLSYIQVLADEFTEKVSHIQEVDCTKALRELFKLCLEHKSFFMGLKKSNMLLFMLSAWNEVLPIIHNQLLDKIQHFPKTKSPKALEYLLSFNVGGTFNMVTKWIDEGMIMSPDELADIVEEFSRGSLISNS